MPAPQSISTPPKKSDAETIRTLRAIVEEQAEQIRQLRAAAQEKGLLPEGMDTPTPSEEAILRVLLRRHGPVSAEGLHVAVYDGRGDVGVEIIRQWICRLRRKLDGTDYSIKTVPRIGYQIERKS